MNKNTSDAMRFLEASNGIDGTFSYHAHRGVEDMVIICHQLAALSGWWDEIVGLNDHQRIRYLASQVALIHSEVSEALEGLRKDKMDDHLPHRKAVEVELADAMIRIMDLAGYRRRDLASAIIEKLAYNQQRADHKRDARAAEGGMKI